MPKLVVTISGFSIKVDFGDYSAAYPSPQYFNARTILNIRPQFDDVDIADVEMTLPYNHVNKIWSITHNQAYVGNEAMIVDTIDGVAPTSREDMMTKIAALMK